MSLRHFLSKLKLILIVASLLKTIVEIVLAIAKVIH
jgi:hypothetical protein